jgi:MutS domain V
MKAHLMFRDRDFDPKAKLPERAPLLVKDLELETVFATMAAGDPFLLEVAKCAVLIGLDAPDEIRYRQAVLADCLKHPKVVRETYDLAVEALTREKKVWGWGTIRTSPEGSLYRSREVLDLFFGMLKRLRRLAERHIGFFQSDAFTTLFKLLIAELSDEYLAEIEDHLHRLTFSDCLVMSARLGSANEGTGYALRQQPRRKRWWERLQDWHASLGQEPNSYSYHISERDEAGARALSDLRNRGLLGVATALGQSTDHLLAFFSMLRAELAFYVGALNLHDGLRAKSTGVSIPDVMPLRVTSLAARQLRDISLVLSSEPPVVGNDLNADDKSLVVITGANRGGKSTFLRSVGQAQVLMQCGLFVCAEVFSSNVSSGVFTHYKREEDATMTSGKLDEELRRMSSIVDHVKPGSVVFCNESFASTNEREGSQIAGQIIAALTEQGIKVLYVTHMFELANRLWYKGGPESLFLRAERLHDGRRTFRIEEGQPFATSYGQDLYRRIFLADSAPPERDVSRGRAPAQAH